MTKDNERPYVRLHRPSPSPLLRASDVETYVRARHLPKLIALWPHELEDFSRAGRERILHRLRYALRAERRRGCAGHWSYDLNRHVGLVRAYKAELQHLKRFCHAASQTGDDSAGEQPPGAKASGAA